MATTGFTAAFTPDGSTKPVSTLIYDPNGTDGHKAATQVAGSPTATTVDLQEQAISYGAIIPMLPQVLGDATFSIHEKDGIITATQTKTKQQVEYTIVDNMITKIVTTISQNGKPFRTTLDLNYTLTDAERKTVSTAVAQNTVPAPPTTKN
jgi:hypothetical protein